MFKREISSAVKALMYDKTKSNIYICEVTSVDETNKMCEADSIIGDSIVGIPGIKLNSESNDGFCLFPAIGSTIIVIMTENKEYYTLAIEDISKMLITIDNNNYLTYDSTGWIWNNGSNNGLVKISPLITALNVRSQRENAIVASLQAIATAATAIGSTPITGTALAGLINTAISAILTPITDTLQSTLENTKIKH